MCPARLCRGESLSFVKSTRGLNSLGVHTRQSPPHPSVELCFFVSWMRTLRWPQSPSTPLLHCAKSPFKLLTVFGENLAGASTCVYNFLAAPASSLGPPPPAKPLVDKSETSCAYYFQTGRLISSNPRVILPTSHGAGPPHVPGTTAGIRPSHLHVSMHNTYLRQKVVVAAVLLEVSPEAGLLVLPLLALLLELDDLLLLLLPLLPLVARSLHRSIPFALVFLRG